MAAPPAFETYTQACNGSPALGPFIGDSWDGLRHGEVRFGAADLQTFSATAASADVAKQLDPVDGPPCRTLPADDDPGAATWRLPAATGAGYTLMGAPTIIGTPLEAHGSFAQVVGRLWDVAPDGKQTLVTHGIFRPQTGAREYQVFQLHPNGWHFAAGHVPKLELVGQSPPYGRAATGSYWLSVGRIELRLPVIEAPDGGAVLAPEPPVMRQPFDGLDVGIPSCGVAPATGCERARGGDIVWRKRLLEWTWRKRYTGGQGGGRAVGSPENSTAYRLCVWDPTAQLATSVAIPAGSCQGKERTGTCWTFGKDAAYHYRDPAGASDGVRSAVLGADLLAVRAKVASTRVRRARAQLLVGGLGCFELPVRR